MKKKRSVRWNTYRYNGKNLQKKNAFVKTGNFGKRHKKRTGKNPSKFSMKLHYRINLFLEKRKQLKKRPKNKTKKSIFQVGINKKDFRIKKSKEKVEKVINTCASFLELSKKLLTTNKLLAVIKVFADVKKIVISLSNLEKNACEYIDLIEIHEGGWFPTKDEFNAFVDVIKNTKEIFDSIKDLEKQLGILAL